MVLWRGSCDYPNSMQWAHPPGKETPLRVCSAVLRAQQLLTQPRVGQGHRMIAGQRASLDASLRVMGARRLGCAHEALDAPLDDGCCRRVHTCAAARLIPCSLRQEALSCSACHSTCSQAVPAGSSDAPRCAAMPRRVTLLPVHDEAARHCAGSTADMPCRAPHTHHTCPSPPGTACTAPAARTHGCRTGAARWGAAQSCTPALAGALPAPAPLAAGFCTPDVHVRSVLACLQAGITAQRARSRLHMVLIVQQQICRVQQMCSQQGCYILES